MVVTNNIISTPTEPNGINGIHPIDQKSRLWAIIDELRTQIKSHPSLQTVINKLEPLANRIKPVQTLQTLCDSLQPHCEQLTQELKINRLLDRLQSEIKSKNKLILSTEDHDLLENSKLDLLDLFISQLDEIKKNNSENDIVKDQIDSIRNFCQKSIFGACWSHCNNAVKIIKADVNSIIVCNKIYFKELIHLLKLLDSYLGIKAEAYEVTNYYVLKYSIFDLLNRIYSDATTYNELERGDINFVYKEIQKRYRSIENKVRIINNHVEEINKVIQKAQENFGFSSNSGNGTNKRSSELDEGKDKPLKRVKTETKPPVVFTEFKFCIGNEIADRLAKELQSQGLEFPLTPQEGKISAKSETKPFPSSEFYLCPDPFMFANPLSQGSPEKEPQSQGETDPIQDPALVQESMEIDQNNSAEDQEKLRSSYGVFLDNAFNLLDVIDLDLSLSASSGGLSVSDLQGNLTKLRKFLEINDFYSFNYYFSYFVDNFPVFESNDENFKEAYKNAFQLKELSSEMYKVLPK